MSPRVVDGEKPGVDSRDEGKQTDQNSLLFVEKIITKELVFSTLRDHRMGVM